MVKLPNETKKCKAWLDAYKGSGAFYTLKNLVMYHGCSIKTDYGKSVTETNAVNYLLSKQNEYRGEGWRYMAMLKKVISDNNFDYKKAVAEK